MMLMRVLRASACVGSLLDRCECSAGTFPNERTREKLKGEITRLSIASQQLLFTLQYYYTIMEYTVIFRSGFETYGLVFLHNQVYSYSYI